jgi:pilus assembly protein Flp/PilA
MKKLMQSMTDSAITFAKEEDGSQVVEYSLIIAVVSIGLVLAIKGLKDGAFADLLTRVDNCLKAGGTCS